jgi:ADP-ribosylglycohydrolase
MNIPSKSAFRGCLLGQCLGDALGQPIEGRDGEECSRYMNENAKKWFGGESPSSMEWRGQYTDDSQLARELIKSLLDRKGFDGEDYARRIAHIFRKRKIVGQGIACSDAAHNLINGIPWKESGVPAPSAGNGTAMRAAPIGLFYYDEPEKMIEMAHWQGYITHHDTRCSAGSVAIAGAIALILRGEADDISSFVGMIADWMRRYSPEFADLFLNLREWMDREPAQAFEPIRKAGKPENHIDGWPGISPFVITSVLWSVYSFLRYRDNFWKAISTAISIGGDVDTTGAMTGAISGAWLGIEALPQHLLKMLNDKGEWGYDELITLADECYRLKCEV